MWHATVDSLDRLSNLDTLVRQGIYRGGQGDKVGTLRGTLGWQNLPGEVDMPDVPVTGTMPEWLSGTLLRTGPGKWDLGRQHLLHWWDGLALLQRFSFAGGKVSYRCRFLDSPGYRAQEATGRISWKSFATDPCTDLMRGEKTDFVEENGNCNINITRIGDVVAAQGEGAMAVTFDPETLQATGWLDQSPADNDIPGHRAVTAHPHRDFDHKIQYNVHTVLGPNPVYQIVSTDIATGTPEILSTVPVERGNPGYRHHFSMTENYVITVEYPLTTDLATLAAGDKPFVACFRWNPTAATKIFITSRVDGTLRKVLETHGFFAVHHANAYEAGDTIFMDVAAYDSAEHMTDFYLDRRHHNSPLSLGQLRRYALPLGSGNEVTCEVLSSQQVELPTYNYGRHNGKPYRYVYSAGMRQDLPEVAYNQIVKVDTQSHVSMTWFQDGCFPGEPVFVPTPGAATEDDGVILCLVLDTTTRTSFLLVLNARDFSEVARAQLDTFIPFGLHGQYLGDHYSSV